MEPDNQPQGKPAAGEEVLLEAILESGPARMTSRAESELVLQVANLALDYLAPHGAGRRLFPEPAQATGQPSLPEILTRVRETGRPQAILDQLLVASDGVVRRLRMGVSPTIWKGRPALLIRAVSQAPV